MSPSSQVSASSLRRQHGVYYTPVELADWMVHFSLKELRRRRSGPENSNQIIHLLDPACGAGIFLERAAAWIHEHQSTEQCLQLCGVDRDAIAVEAAEKKTLPFVSKQISRQIVTGDALLGPDFRGPFAGDSCTGVNWGKTFPEAHEHGGFDLIIANPPYRREKDAREQFTTIAETPLGQKWRRSRMDLWHYFLHRSLDLLHPRGLLCFVVNSYWTHSSGASKLIARLREETDLVRIVDFDQWPLFPGVQGRHHVFWLAKKEAHEPSCQVFQLATEAKGTVFSEDLWESLEQEEPQTSGAMRWEKETFTQDELYAGERLIPHRRATVKAFTLLAETHEVRQGVAENPPVVSRRQATLFPECGPAGSGVFVLTDEELAALRLNENERRLVRTYWETAELERYREPECATKSILYLTAKTAPALQELPNIERHLQQFRKLLEKRREVQLGKIGWWHLHWPREKRLFQEPRIVAVQMGARPRFLYTETPAIVGFSCHVILQRDVEGMSLPALCGVLNSGCALEWFGRFAKRRGVSLEISGETLRQFPIPLRDRELEERIAALVMERQGIRGATQGEEIEGKIEALVGEMWG